MAGVVGLAGWGLAAAAALVAAGALRALMAQREAAARAAHELRGPLTAISLGLELQARRASARAQRWSGLQLELLQAAAALEDLTAPGRPAARLERIEVAELLEACASGCEPRAVAAGVELVWEWEGPPAFVWGDRARLAQGFGNLLANALEHGAGPVTIGGLASPGSGSVRIEVTDRGPGLPAPVSALARRARAGRGRRGRGLAIALAIFEAHHGRLACAPAQAGARLVIELPAVVPDGAVLRPQGPQPS